MSRGLGRVRLGVGWVTAASLLLCACAADMTPAPGAGSGSGGRADAGSDGNGSGGGGAGGGGSGGASGTSSAAGSGGNATGSGGGSAIDAGSGAGTSGGDGSSDSSTVSDGRDGSSTGDGAGSAGALYPPPPRELKLELTGRSDAQINFAPSAADPAAKSFHGNNYAVFRNNAAVVQKKLVIGLHGINNGAGPGGALSWAAGRGFHVIGVDYANSSGGENGAGYLETWSGEDKSTGVTVAPVDSVQNRIKTGLAYLAMRDKGADWGYYLNADGSVRWNDVIAFGYSFGGQTVVAATKYVPLARGIAVSAPSLDATKALWMMAMPNVTPVSRSYMISGTTDGGHAAHLKAAIDLGWIGPKVNASTSAPPYSESHSLEVNFGHSEFCSVPGYDAVCDYVFGTLKM